MKFLNINVFNVFNLSCVNILCNWQSKFLNLARSLDLRFGLSMLGKLYFETKNAL